MEAITQEIKARALASNGKLNWRGWLLAAFVFIPYVTAAAIGLVARGARFAWAAGEVGFEDGFKGRGNKKE